LADEVYVSGDVLLFVGEDSRRDVEARLAGILEYYNIPPAALGGRLHIVYLSEIDPLTYTFAKMLESITVMNRELLDWVQKFPGLVAIFIDPIAAWHLILENDNGAMKVLCTEFRRTAVIANIHLVSTTTSPRRRWGIPKGHVGNLAAARGAYIVSDARWAFTMAKLRSSTARDYGIESHQISRWRRLDSLKASHGPEDGEMRLLEVKSVTIANGEDVAVLTEGDAHKVRAAAVEREATADVARAQALTQALTEMLVESCPRSADAAAKWLQERYPHLFPDRRGKCLSTKTIRERLVTFIGGDSILFTPVNRRESCV
jgi:transposase-like protein